MYKKITFLMLFLSFSCILFAQQRQENTQLEGIWQGVTENDSTTSFIFRSNNLIMTDQNEIVVGTFIINNRIINFNVEYMFMGSEWKNVVNHNIRINFEYMFSGNNLIVVNEGDQISLKKIE